MPYFTQTPVYTYKRVAWTKVGMNGYPEPYGNFTVDFGESEPISVKQRSGTNTIIDSDNNFEFLWKKRIKHFYKKKIVGYKTISYRKTVWFKDNFGKSRKYTKLYFRDVPIKVRYLVTQLVESPFDRPKNVYLAPNSLDFSYQSVFMQPNRVSIDYKCYFPISGDQGVQGSILLNGPGSFSINLLGITNTYAPAHFTYVRGNPIGTFIPPITDDPFTDKTALYGLYSKVANDLPDYFTAAAEGHETLKELEHILKYSVKFLKELRTLGFLQTASRYANRKVDSKTLSDLWLAWYLSISPNVQLAKDTIDLSYRDDRLWRSYSKSATFEESTVTNELGVLFDGTYGIGGEFNRRIRRYGVIIQSRLVKDEYLYRSGKLGTLASSAWAVIPYSFIFDWINNLSQYLMSYSIFDELQYKAWHTNVDVSNSWQKSSFISRESVYGYIRYIESPQFYTKSISFRCQRLKLDNVPSMPFVKWRKPVTNETTLNRTLTVLSLIISNIKGGR